MAHENKSTETAKTGKDASQTVEVLYQKLGNRWYAFSLIDDDVFVGSISQEEINQLSDNKNDETPSPKMAVNS